MKKVISVISIAVLLLVSLSLPVFAVDFTENTSFVESWILDYPSQTWINMTASSTWNPDTGQFFIHRSNDTYKFGGFKAVFDIDSLVQAQPGYYLQFMVTIQEQYNPGSMPSNYEYTYGMNIVLNDGQMIDLQPSNIVYNIVSGMPTWNAYFTAYVGGDRTVSVRRCAFITNQYSNNAGNTSYSCTIKFNGGSTPTSDTIRHLEMVEIIGSSADKIIANDDENTQDIIDNADENTDEIVENADENTDEIVGAIGDQTEELTNGWESDEDPAADLDNVVEDLGNAETEALGGKSDEEIQEEVSAALDSSSFPPQDSSGSFAVASMFDDLLHAFGDEYQSLLILALTLGLAAFLVGRSYRAKGD